jgi:hypothetical protein
VEYSHESSERITIFDDDSNITHGDIIHDRSTNLEHGIGLSKIVSKASLKYPNHYDPDVVDDTQESKAFGIGFPFVQHQLPSYDVI